VVYSTATFVLLREDARVRFFATLILRTLIGVSYVIGKHLGLSTWPPELESAYAFLYKALVEFVSIGIMEMCPQTFSELGVLGAVIVTGHSEDIPGNKGRTGG